MGAPGSKIKKIKMKKSERLLVRSLIALTVVFFSFQVGSLYNLDNEHQAQIERILAESERNPNADNDSHVIALKNDGGARVQEIVDAQAEFYAQNDFPVYTQERKDHSLELTSVKKVIKKAVAESSDVRKIHKGFITELHKSGFGWTSNNEVNDFKKLVTRKGLSEENTLTYSNVYPHTDIRYTQENDVRNMDIVITDPRTFQSIPNEAEDFVFVEHVKLPAGWKADLTDNEVKIFDTDQNFVMMYPLPIAEDSLCNYEDGAYTLEQTDGGFVLQMTMDMKWLKDDFRTYPIVIDPSFELMN